MRTRLAGLVVLVCLLALGPAAAADKVALVIGNGRYANATPLPNPPNDAEALAKALATLGFEVARGRDLDRNAMEGMVRDFLRKAEGAKVALLFYAGHGLQVDGRNYLVPVDARLERASDLDFETVELDKILGSLDDPARATIVILDACRDNPLARSFRAKLGASRSGAVGAGLAAYSSLGTGTLIAFATAPGQTAADGQGANSPFTEALVRHVATPDLEVRQMLTRVRADVAAATRNQQIPWDNSSLLGEVYLAGPSSGGAARPPVAPPRPPALPPVARQQPPAAPAGDFILPQSGSRLISRSELRGFSNDQLRIARNEIFARRGRFFRDPALAAHFSRYSWYKPFAWDVRLTPVEEANVKTIQSMER